MYNIVFIIILIGTIFELNNKKSKNILYLVILFTMMFMLCFRYGQGTDYFGYNYLFNSVPDNLNGFIENHANIHGEIGWNFVIFIFRSLNFPFEFFIFVISVLMMICLFYAIKKYSPLRICSLLLFFPTYYLTYYYSAIRQGLALGLFLMLGLDKLLNKKYKQYLGLILILSLFHSSFFLLIVLPIFTNEKIEKYKKFFLPLAIVIFVIGYLGGFKFIPGINVYFSRKISIEGILIRIIYYFIVNQLHEKVKYYNNYTEKKLFNIYSMGFYIYIALSFASTLSQRMTMPLKAIEIILIPIQIYILYNNKDKKIIESLKNKLRFIFNKKSVIILYTIVIIFVPTIEFYKNINSYIQQGNYYKNINVFNYPYISVWNKEDVDKYIYSNGFLKILD